MKIIEYRKQDDINVQFLDNYGHIVYHNIYSNFKRGSIKNPYDKKICGIGYAGVGKYVAFVDGVHTTQYNAWVSMLKRCYFTNEKDLHPAYYNISTVCESWLNFQDFGKWYDGNFYQVGVERMHIDKDIIVPGNKEYSPATCIFVPQRINMIFQNRTNPNGLPNGIGFQNGKYTAQYSDSWLGSFDAITSAFETYAVAKKNHIKKIADEYRNTIPEKLYTALIKYRVLIENDKNYNPQLSV